MIFEAEIGQCGAHLSSLEGDLYKIGKKIEQSSKKTYQSISFKKFQIIDDFFPAKFLLSLKRKISFTQTSDNSKFTLRRPPFNFS
jgi:hypothetical protein